MGHDSSRRTIMNALKNVLFFGLLLAALGGVYISLNRSPEPTLPPGLSGDTAPPRVEMGQAVPPVGNIPAPVTGNPPALAAQPPAMSAPPLTAGGAAPPFRRQRQRMRPAPHRHGPRRAIRPRCRPHRLPRPRRRCGRVIPRALQIRSLRQIRRCRPQRRPQIRTRRVRLPPIRLHRIRRRQFRRRLYRGRWTDYRCRRPTMGRKAVST